MMDKHAEESSDHDLRVHLAKNPVTLAFTNIATEKFIYPADEIAEELVREFMFLKSRVEDHPHERDIGLMFFERLPGKVVEDTEIIPRLHCGIQRFVMFPRVLVQPLGAFLCIEQGTIQLVLRREVLEHHRLGNA